MNITGFLIRLAGSVGLIVAGGLLIAMGVATLYNMHKLGLLLDQPGIDGGGSNRDMLEEMGVDLNGKLAWIVWAKIAGQAFLGLVLLILGIRGLIVRLAQGLPPAAEAAETPEGRIGHVLGFGLGTVLGLYLMVSALAGNARELVPKLIGQSATAVVVDSRTVLGEKWHQKYLTYRFETPGGRTVETELEVTARFLREHEPGSTVEVRYVPRDPAQNMLPDAVSYTGFTVKLGFYAFLIVAGIGGVRRNLNYAG